jgi:hypothetical protein
MRGRPTKVKVVAEAVDPEVGRKLWEMSEELTGVVYALALAEAAPSTDRN